MTTECLNETALSSNPQGDLDDWEFEEIFPDDSEFGVSSSFMSLNGNLKPNDEYPPSEFNPIITEFIGEIEKNIGFKTIIEPSENLMRVLDSRDNLKVKKSDVIEFSKPVITQESKPVIFPNTINIIQGQAGSHKSRLAENICSAFLKLPSCKNELLGFKRTNYNADHLVIYVDTERNNSEQLPFALQSIQVMAGYDKNAHPSNFDYCSLLNVPRKERFRTLTEALDILIKDKSKPTFVVLDVSTDCLEDFNQIGVSMELIDSMNEAICNQNIIFLCLIHENPGSFKARGHFGTELMNKASTAIQVTLEKEGDLDIGLIKVSYLKCRSSAKHHPFFAKYCNEIKGLKLATPDEVEQLKNSRKIKAKSDDIVEAIKSILVRGDSYSRVEFIQKLRVMLNASERTIEERLKKVIESKLEISNDSGEIHCLSKENIGGTVIYKLTLKPPF
jgi:hypothetical protein